MPNRRRRNFVLQSLSGAHHHLPRLDSANPTPKAAEEAAQTDDPGELEADLAHVEGQGWEERVAGYPRRRRGGGEVEIIPKVFRENENYKVFAGINLFLNL